MKQLKPFLLAAILWVIISFWINRFFLAPNPFSWVALFGGVSLLNLFALSKVCSSFMGYYAPQKNEVQRGSSLLIIFFLCLKLIALGSLIFLLFHEHMGQPLSKILGVSAMVFVPLAGGMLWHRLGFQNKNGSLF